jgi:hypothetical protein
LFYKRFLLVFVFLSQFSLAYSWDGNAGLRVGIGFSLANSVDKAEVHLSFKGLFGGFLGIGFNDFVELQLQGYFGLHNPYFEIYHQINRQVSWNSVDFIPLLKFRFHIDNFGLLYVGAGPTFSFAIGRVLTRADSANTSEGISDFGLRTPIYGIVFEFGSEVPLSIGYLVVAFVSQWDVVPMSVNKEHFDRIYTNRPIALHLGYGVKLW